jgi:hypothetical protein
VVREVGLVEEAVVMGAGKEMAAKVVVKEARVAMEVGRAVREGRVAV